MNILQMKLVVDHAINYIRIFKDPNEVDVVVNSYDRADVDGARGHVGLLDADLGIDADAGLFRLEPERPMVRYGFSNNALVRPTIEYKVDGQRIYRCRMCGRVVNWDRFYFCPYCGQRFKRDDE